MLPFTYSRAAAADGAVKAATPPTNGSRLPAIAFPTQFLAGGTTLLDLMKLEVMTPGALVDINALERGPMGGIEAGKDGLRLGALARMGPAAENEIVRRQYPVIAQSLELAASQQLRNMASLGGNVLQRTRCNYFRDVSWAECNKRNPGSGCAAIKGAHRQHAILGVSDACIASYPGDFAQALVALDATVEIAGPKGTRKIPFSALHPQPGDRPHVEHTLAPGELIIAFTVPAGAWTRRSLYLKIRDRESYAFALASAAVALDMQGGVVREARIGLGGVAAIPWRAREAEAALKGKKLDERTAAAAADAAFAAARPHEDNRFKIRLGKETLTRALLQAAAMEV